MSGDLAQRFDAAQCVGSVCVRIDTSAGEVSLSADESVVAASVIKVLVALAAECEFVEGRVDPALPVLLPAAARTPGPTGMSLYDDDVTVSARDLVSAMLTISDNAATDALLALVGIDRCNQLAVDLGLHATVMVGNLADMVQSIARDAGFPDWTAMSEWQARNDVPVAERDEVARLVRESTALRPSTATRTTARDMCWLMELIWTDRAGPVGACRRVRAHMARQLTRNRLAAGFPPPARVAAKSGGLMGIVRNEVGVIEQDGATVYAAVFTHASPAAVEADVNAAIGDAAAMAARALLQ